MKTNLILIVLLIMFSCTGGNKKTLDSENSQKKKAQSEQTDFESDTMFKGEPQNEKRRVDAAAPPTIIDISGHIESKDLNLSDFYPNVSFIKLQHPNSDKGKSFVINSTGMPMPTKTIPPANAFIKMSKNTPSPTFLSLVSYKNKLLLGNLTGLFCYAKDGKHLYTLFESDEFSDLSNSATISIDMNSVDKALCGFSVLDDMCAYATTTEGKSTLHIYDMKSEKEIHQKTMPLDKTFLLNGKHKTLLNYAYNVEAKESLPFMYSLTATNDTICRFFNKNIFTDMKGMSTFFNPGDPDIYYFEDKLFVRQQGNDTIYRFGSEYEINPAYVFKTGNYKATIQDIIKGNIRDKRSINKVLETSQLLMFSIKGSDDVYYYDKSTKKVYRSEMTYMNIESGALHFNFEGLHCSEKSVYGVYTKKYMDIITKDKTLRFPPKMLATINKWKDELKDGEILLMLLE